MISTNSIKIGKLYYCKINEKYFIPIKLYNKNNKRIDVEALDQNGKIKTLPKHFFEKFFVIVQE